MNLLILILSAVIVQARQLMAIPVDTDDNTRIVHHRERRAVEFVDVDDVDDGKVRDPIFLISPEDFDELPTDPGTVESRGTAIDEKTTEKSNRIPEITGKKRPASCDYDPEVDLEAKVSQIERGSKRVSEIQCEYNMWEYKYRVIENDRNLEDCRNKSEDYSEVYNGKKAIQGDFPHMGAVGWRRPANSFDAATDPYIFKCGSSLISSRFALTAAHCNASREDPNTEYRKPEIVRFGTVYIGTGKEKPAEADVPIRRIHILPKYRSLLTRYNDIALLELGTEVQISLNIRPACLYTGTERIPKANVTGWGKTTTADSSFDLLFGTLDIYHERTNCANTFKNTFNWAGLLDHQICAGTSSGKVDTCQGDSGSPLQIQSPLPSHINENGVMYYLLGVTSSGIHCGWENTPGIYTKVSDHNFLCWIERIVWPSEENTQCPGERFRGYDVK